MLRRALSEAPDLDTETRVRTRPEPERTSAPAPERPNLETLRADMQRRLAAQLDLGTPEAAPTPPPPPPPVVEERIHIPKTQRPPMQTRRAEAQRNTTVRVERRSATGFFSSFGGRRRLKPSQMLLVVVALIAGGLAAFLATQHEQPITPAIAAQPAPQVVREATAQVLVAKKGIGVGQRLTPDLVEWQDWPQGAVRSEYISEASAPKAIADLSGALSRFEFSPGEPILKQKLALPGQGYLSAVLDAGKRGVSLPVTADSASGGFVLPDDHVDVVVTRNDTKASDTILHNVRVLAVDKRLGQASTAAPVAPGAPGAGAAPADPNDPNSTSFSNQAIATLELDPSQAEIVISAAATGKLTLVLLPLADFATADTGEKQTTDQAIRMTSPFWTSGTPSAPQTLH